MNREPPNETLTEAQQAQYRAEGYLVLENRVPESALQKIRDEIDRFVEEARGLTASNERIDLEDSHSPTAPRVRRVKSPYHLSPTFRELAKSDFILAPLRDLLGLDLRLHGSKLNMKAAGYGAAVEWHQDWAFYPHSSDDILAVGVMIDDMAAENGPLMVFPGSHRGPVHDHHAGGVFAGAMQPAACGLDPKDAVMLTGPQDRSPCIMSAWCTAPPSTPLGPRPAPAALRDRGGGRLSPGRHTFGLWRAGGVRQPPALRPAHPRAADHARAHPSAPTATGDTGVDLRDSKSDEDAQLRSWNRINLGPFGHRQE